MRVSRLAPVPLLASLAFAFPAHALEIVAEDRRIIDNHDNCPGAPTLQTIQAPFLATLDHPVQSSSFTFDADLLGFGGTASGLFHQWHDEFEGCIEFVNQQTFYSFTFRIDGDGQLMARGTVAAHTFSISRVEPYASLYFVDPRLTQPVAADLVLAPGEYGVSVSPNGQADGGNFDLTFSIRDTAVPLPDPETNECGNGSDDDGDGLADYPADLDCLSVFDDSEATFVQWRVEDGGNGHFYEFVSQTLRWPAARMAAEQRTPPAGYAPGHLASVGSAAEDDFLWSTFASFGPGNGAWIGFSDELVEGEWRWVDATPGIWQDPDVFATPVQTVPYVNWGPGEPNDLGGEDYALLAFSDRWNDGLNTSTSNYYYVEYEPAGPDCGNGLDDDADGLVDTDDPGCPHMDAWPENPPCDDGVDNDDDGLVDFDDPVCDAVWPYWEASPCGLGAELVLALPLLNWLRGRRAACAGA